ncbi:MAG: phosphoadenosine phosphosulfate reductase family protein [Methanobrevibacter sp.]|nr:phosphoadenosine phosphosulfate reductase family protein [Methanobrevibacter sp.]
MRKKIQKSIDILEKAKLEYPQILVGLSGGKDSLAVLDLCLKVFGRDNVVCFNMQYLPGLRAQKETLDYARKRFNLTNVIEIPAENFWLDFKSGIYGWEDMWKEDLPKVNRKLIFLKLVKETGIMNIAVGIKKSDNLRIRQQWEQNLYYGGMVAPLWDFTAVDVIQYNILNKIEISKQTKDGFRGVGLEDYDLYYIYKHYPEDFKEMEKFFPFIGAKIFQIERWNISFKKHFV